MDYVIKIGKNFIGYNTEGRYDEVDSISKAIRGELHRLSNIVNNSITPSKRGRCKVVAFDKIKEEPIVAPKHTAEVHVTSMFDTIFEQIKKIDLCGFGDEQSNLSKKLSKVDKEITDIRHYIEFSKLNAAEGYKAFKLLQDKLIERRVIKDDLSKFEILASAKVSDIYDGTLECRIDEFYNRDYTPRVLKELFTDKGKD